MFALAALPAAALSTGVELRYDSEAGVVEARGLPESWLCEFREWNPSPAELAALMVVRVAPADPAEPVPADTLPVGGSVAARGDAIAFKPNFPFRPGMTYQVDFDAGALAGSSSKIKIGARIVVPRRPESPPPRLLTIHPEGDRLPENQLKLYLVFSKPIRRGAIYRALTLETDDGRIVEDPFLELPEELWDPSGTRLTLLFDPGRIKRGLRPREEAGPILEEGGRYVLTVRAEGLRDSEGRPLVADVRKTFEATAPDMESPRPEKWRIEPPRAGTRDPLAVRFDEPLDRAMLDRVLRVRRSDAAPDAEIPGAIVVERGETVWRFVPEGPWEPGPHRLEIEETLEDRAGNRIDRLFEVDRLEPIEERVSGVGIRVREFAIE